LRGGGEGVSGQGEGGWGAERGRWRGEGGHGERKGAWVKVSRGEERKSAGAAYKTCRKKVDEKSKQGKELNHYSKGVDAPNPKKNPKTPKPKPV